MSAQVINNNEDGDNYDSRSFTRSDSRLSSDSRSHLRDNKSMINMLYQGELSPANFVEGTKEAVDDAFLLTKLFFVLLSWFGVGYMWIWRTLQMFSFITILMPGFLKVMVWWYLTSDRVYRGIEYRKNTFRNQLDIFVPDSINSDLSSSNGDLKKKAPVVIYLNGGAWIIGYKWWSAHMAKIFTDNDIILVSPDYRNFPQVNIKHMMGDTEAAILWVKNNIGSYGGDANNIWVVGHSAGAHIGAMNILNEAERERLELHPPRSSNPHANDSWNGYTREIIAEEHKPPTWRSSSLKGYLGLSGPYDLAGYADHANWRGLYRGVLAAIVRNDLSFYSPSRRVGQAAFNPNFENPINQFIPQIGILHGKVDKTVPFHFANDFGNSLNRCGVKDCHVKIYEGKNHTDLQVEDVMSGDNPILTDIISIVLTGSVKKVLVNGEKCDIYIEPTLPNWYCDWARWVNPF